MKTWISECHKNRNAKRTDVYYAALMAGADSHTRYTISV
jgi:hypothetical protein